MEFAKLNIMPEILKALKEEAYINPTDIQSQAIPLILQGNDILGSAQTGTGKTAAFAVPILQLLSETKVHERGIKALILTPTRELAIQIYESFKNYGKYTRIRSVAVYGGVSQKPQEAALRRGVDVLIATPGRLMDLMNQKIISLKNVRILTLDEADRMLDMGFIHDVRRIISSVPEQRQTLFFSATLPPIVAEIAGRILKDPVKVDVIPDQLAVELIDQSLYYVEKADKRALLLHLLKDTDMESVLVFSRTKYGADRIVKELRRNGIDALAIHGDKSQGARQTALSDFKKGKIRVLVATDIAARGLDINDLSHVINFDLPEISESYVHRIGRTGRAGKFGKAISFCTSDEKKLLSSIERLCGNTVTVVSGHPFEPLFAKSSQKIEGRARVKDFSIGRRRS